MRLFFVILLSIISICSNANYNFNKNCQKAFLSIISLKFNEGNNLILREKVSNPKNCIPYYLESYIDFLSVVISESSSSFEKFKSNKSLRLNNLGNGDKNSPYYLCCRAEIHLQNAYSKMIFKEYLSGAYEINKAYRLLEENHEKFPDFIPNYKSLGLLHAIIGTIPDDYKWVAKVINVRGTVNQGVIELSKVLVSALSEKKYEYLIPESVFLLSFIQMNLQNNSNTANRLMQIFKKPIVNNIVIQNPLLTYCKANIAIKTGNNDKAISLLLACPKRKSYFYFYYLDYITGIAKLNRLDADSYKYLNAYVSNFKGRSYVKSAYQKLAWYYLINGNKKKYKDYMSRILYRGDNLTDSDKQALKEAESGEIPNVHLLRSRLLFDGGYYSKAHRILLSKKPGEICRNKKDKIEYTYRLARIYHELNKIEKAVSFYKMTIKNNANYKYYFAANSALQLGLIYEKQKNYSIAKEYYKKAISIETEEYKNSIQQKSKAGLERIK